MPYSKALIPGLLGTTSLVFVGWLNLPAAADENADQIIVTGSPLDRTTTELAVPVTILNRDEIVRQGGATLGELLSRKPGIADSSFARGASRPIIRGLDNFRIRLQENGVASHDVSDLSEDHGTPIDPLAAQRIEVIRGPATLRYGSQAIGGVVSVLNNRIPSSLPASTFETELLSTFSTLDDGYEGAGLIDFGAGQFAGHIDGFYRNTDDYDIPRAPGVQENSDNESAGIAGGGSILFGNGFLGASIAYFQSEYGIPGGEAAEESVFIDLEQTKIAVKGEINNLHSFIDTVRLDAGYSDYTHDEIIGAENFVGSTFDNEEWELRGEAVHTKLGPFEGAVGLQVGQRDLEGSGEAGELIAPAERYSVAGFIFEEWDLTERATLQFAARIEHTGTEGFGVTPPSLDGSLVAKEIDDFGADADRDFTPISGSGGIVFDLGWNTSLGGILQYVERAPDLLELYAKGPHEATETFEIGDPNLNKEKAFSIEATVKRTEGPFTFDVAAFYTKYEGFIFKNFTGFVCGEEFESCGVEGAPGVEDELTQIAYAQADAQFYGFEASAEWDALEIAGGVLGFDGRFDMVEAEFDDGGNVPRITPLRYGGGAFFESSALFARIGILRVNRQEDTAVNEDPTKGYTDLRAELTYAFSLPGTEDKTVEIGIIGSNLLDADQRNHLSFKKEDVLLPGASGRFFVRARF